MWDKWILKWIALWSVLYLRVFGFIVEFHMEMLAEEEILCPVYFVPLWFPLPVSLVLFESLSIINIVFSFGGKIIAHFFLVEKEVHVLGRWRKHELSMKLFIQPDKFWSSHFPLVYTSLCWTSSTFAIYDNFFNITNCIVLLQL